MQYDDNNKTSLILMKIAVAISLCMSFSSAGYAQDTGNAKVTEETTCYDRNNEEIACPAPDEVMPFAVPVLQDNGNRTITDFQTRLTWQQDTVDVNGDGTLSTKDTLNWKDAIAYCENLEMAGKDDWRLPGVDELDTIVDFTRKFPAVKPPFTSQSSYYWSSTRYLYKKTKAWSVSFYFGNNVWSFKSSKFFLRCVRGGQVE